VSEAVPLSDNAGSVVEFSLKPKPKSAYTAYQNIHVKIGQDEYTYSEAWRMAAKGEKKDYFSVPEDLRDQLYYSDATIWLEPGGVDRTYKAGTPHEAESPWGTQPGKFELRPIPNGVRTIRRRTTLRWDAHGQLMLPIAEKRTVMAAAMEWHQSTPCPFAHPNNSRIGSCTWGEIQYPGCESYPFPGKPIKSCRGRPCPKPGEPGPCVCPPTQDLVEKTDPAYAMWVALRAE
jgi:hypothetical protein